MPVRGALRGLFPELDVSSRERSTTVEPPAPKPTRSSVDALAELRAVVAERVALQQREYALTERIYGIALELQHLGIAQAAVAREIRTVVDGQVQPISRQALAQAVDRRRNAA